MERVTILTEDRDYDRLVHTGLPECGDLKFALKEHAMQSGRAGVVVAFTVTLPDGTRQPVQAVTSLRNMLGVCAALKGYAARVGQEE